MELLVKRDGTGVALIAVAEAINKVEVATEKVVTELIISRHEREIESLCTYRAQVSRQFWVTLTSGLVGPFVALFLLPRKVYVDLFVGPTIEAKRHRLAAIIMQAAQGRPVSLSQQIAPHTAEKQGHVAGFLLFILLGIGCFWWLGHDSSKTNPTDSPPNAPAPGAVPPAPVDGVSQTDSNNSPNITPVTGNLPPPLVSPATRDVNVPPPAISQSDFLSSQLRDAEAAVQKAKVDLETAKAAAIQKFHSLPDYTSAEAEIEETKAAKDAAVEKQRMDKYPEDDQEDVNTTVAAWLEASKKLNTMYLQSVDADPVVVQKQEVLDKLMDVVAVLQNRISAESKPLTFREREEMGNRRGK